MNKFEEWLLNGKENDALELFKIFGNASEQSPEHEEPRNEEKEAAQYE